MSELNKELSRSECTTKVISIPYDLYKSEIGKYFIGQTGLLISDLTGLEVMAALVNPIDSDVNIYLNAVTITNIGATPISGDIYLQSTFTSIGAVESEKISSANVACIKNHKAHIEYILEAITPTDGVNIFERIVSPNSTEVIDGSQIIIPPGQALIVLLGQNLPITTNDVAIAFGWWEQKIKH